MHSRSCSANPCQKRPAIQLSITCRATRSSPAPGRAVSMRRIRRAMGQPSDSAATAASSVRERSRSKKRAMSGLEKRRSFAVTTSAPTPGTERDKSSPGGSARHAIATCRQGARCATYRSAVLRCPGWRRRPRRARPRRAARRPRGRGPGGQCADAAVLVRRRWRGAARAGRDRRPGRCGRGTRRRPLGRRRMPRRLNTPSRRRVASAEGSGVRGPGRTFARWQHPGKYGKKWFRQISNNAELGAASPDCSR